MMDQHHVLLLHYIADNRICTTHNKTGVFLAILILEQFGHCVQY